MEPSYSVVWPKSAAAVPAQRLARRTGSLAGMRIGWVWDGLFRGEELFPIFVAEIARREPSAMVLGAELFGNIHGPHEHAVIEALPGILDEHGIDAVVVGNGC